MIYGRTETLMTSLLWKTYRFYFAMGLFRNISQMTPKRDKNTSDTPGHSHIFVLTTFCWGLSVNKAGKLHESILYLFIYIFFSFLQVRSAQDQLQLQLLLRRQLQRRCRCSLVEELVEPWNRLMLQPWVGVLISGVCCFPEQAPLPFVQNFTFCHEEADIIFIEKKSANLSMCNENIS